MQSTPIFWTDTTQANERLASTIILYDGLPYYVTEAFNGDDGKARVLVEPDASPCTFDVVEGLLRTVLGEVSVEDI